jgi:hypothetical protein
MKRLCPRVDRAGRLFQPRTVGHHRRAVIELGVAGSTPVSGST